MGFVATVLAALGSLVAGLGSNACYFFILDEPECPKSLIK